MHAMVDLRIGTVLRYALDDGNDSVILSAINALQSMLAPPAQEALLTPLQLPSGWDPAPTVLPLMPVRLAFKIENKK